MHRLWGSQTCCGKLPFAESRWFNSKPGLAFMNSDKGKDYFSKFGVRFLRMRDAVRNVRDHAQSQSRRAKRTKVTMDDEVSVQSIRSNRSAERDRSYSLDSRHSRDSQSRDEQGNRDRRLGYNADSRKNRERDRERDRGRERNRDHHGSASRGHGSHRDDRGRDSRSHYESRDRDTRASDRRSSEPTKRRERSVSASRDGSGTKAAESRTRESSADRGKTAAAGAGGSSRGRSASPHAPRDKTSCECLDTANEYVQVCEYLNTVTSRTVLQEEDCLLAASLPHPADPNNPDLPRLFVECLPDTGAWSANYINEATAEWLRAMGVNRQECRVYFVYRVGARTRF